MPQNDAWDWPVLMYVATVLLKRSEREFWRMTPKKLNALTEAHIALNGGRDEDTPKEEKPRVGFIDQVF